MNGDDSQSQSTDQHQRPTSSCCRRSHCESFNHSAHFTQGDAVCESDAEEAFSPPTGQTEPPELVNVLAKRFAIIHHGQCVISRSHCNSEFCHLEPGSSDNHDNDLDCGLHLVLLLCLLHDHHPEDLLLYLSGPGHSSIYPVYPHADQRHHMLGVVTFRITPYNLGIMSLERYVAVCFPLRYAMLCTSRRIKISIGAMWVIGILPNFAELAVIKDYLKNRSAPVVCNRGANLINKLQNMIKTAFLIINFSLVGLIIIFTYVKVLLVARKIGSANTVASKAVKTVVLHAFQFLLCMMSFLSSATEANSDFEGYIRLANFIFFMCLPRFLSPFIFGLRDEALSSYMKQVIKFKYKKQIQ
ncbi:odorant receptor 131-2-like [Hyperolius riggenbachi]|uniref:odorant receptor 131-2-like n=1 Tax=Hyperolius riggenbachi TaxID=752182 RepID=UPI0035A39FB8